MTTTQATHLYEGLFLFNSAQISSSTAAATSFLTEVFDRAGAEVLALYKWDERKLAYEIKGQKRGLYMLAYFRVHGSAIGGIERDINLSELVTRCLLLRADHVGDIELQEARKHQQRTQDEIALGATSSPEATVTTSRAPEPAEVAAGDDPSDDNQ